MGEKIVFLSIVLIMFFTGYNINKLSNTGIYFGVRIPSKFKEDKDLLKEFKLYKKWFLLLNVPIICIVGLFINMKESATMILVGTIIVIIATGIPRIIFWKRLKALKESKGWIKESKNMVVVDTSLRKPSKNRNENPLPTKYFILLIIFPIITLILTVMNFDKLPDLVPIHFNFQGIADGFADKGTRDGIVKIYSLVLSQFFIVGLFIFINKVIIKGKTDLNGGGIKALVIKKRKFKRINSIFMFVMGLEIEILYLAMQIAIIFNLNIQLINIIQLVVVSMTGIIYVIISFIIGQGGKNISINENEEEIYRDDDKHWIFGSLYYNKNDMSLMVEKRVGVGYTINVAHPIGMLIGIGTILLLVGSLVYMIYMGI